MTKRSAALLLVMLMMGAALAGCSGEAAAPPASGADMPSVPPSPPSVSSPGTPGASPAAEPAASPSASASAAAASASPESVAQPTYEDVVARNFTGFVALPQDGYEYDGFAVLDADTVLLVAYDRANSASKVLLLNGKTGMPAEVYADAGRVEAYSLEAAFPEGAKQPQAQWLVHSEDGADSTVQWKNGVSRKFPGLLSSAPGDSWGADYGGGREGIWGLNESDGAWKPWTKGKADERPLWLPNGSGFIYLMDTGERLGDGAGPKYALAKYDRASGKTAKLPFEEGFWGGIEWMTPGRTILAHNGFDDGIGLKVVDLAARTEKQILSTTDLDYTRDAYSPAAKRILVSERGTFSFFDESGKTAGAMPWPGGLNASLRVNPDYRAASPESGGYYAAAIGAGRVGPDGFRFSPDGKRLAYWLGALGDSADDIVHGAILVAGRSDGGEARALTSDFFRFREAAWAPDSNRLFALFAPADGSQGAYVGWIDVD